MFQLFLNILRPLQNSFSPTAEILCLGFGCLGKNEKGYFAKVSSGQPVVIKSKRDMIEVGKTYKVFHWDIKPRTRADNPHWSVTGS